MRLSVCLLLQELEQHYRIKMPKTTATRLVLQRPRLYTGEERLIPERVYIGNASELAALQRAVPADTLLLCIGESAHLSALSYDNVCYVYDDVSLYGLLNAVQGVFDFYDHWESVLQNSVSGKETLANLLNASFEVFHNPIFVNASDFFLVAYSNIIEDSKSMELLTDPIQSYETMSILKLDPFFNQARGFTDVFSMPDYLTGYRELCVNLFEHKTFAYRVRVPEILAPLPEGYDALLRYLADYIQLALRQADISEAHRSFSLESLLIGALNQEIRSFAQIERGFSDFGWDPQGEYCFLCIKPAAADRENQTLHFICDYFEKLIDGAYAFVYKDRIAVLIYLGRFGGTQDEAIDRAVLFLRDSYLKTGVSTAFFGALDLANRFEQARLALELGEKRRPERWLHRFQDYALDYVAERCMDGLPVELICSPAIMTLKRHDAAHETDYLNTLRLYLDSGLNAVQTAKQLYIHRSTFLYRLEKIAEMTGIDLDDRDTRLYLAFSFRLLDAARGPAPAPAPVFPLEALV